MSSFPFIIIGGGGHAKILMSAILSRPSLKISGILDQNLPTNSLVYGYKILGNDSLMDSPEYASHRFAIGVGFMKSAHPRRILFERLKTLKKTMPPIVHAQAIIDSGVTLPDSLQVMAGAIINPDCRLGINIIINTGAIIEHDCVLGDHAHVAPGAVLGGGVRVGSESLIGLGARILPGITIGSQVIVGAGALVTRDIPDGTLVTGVPAHPQKA